jgi:tripartite-type tricarboxylate transporter receptor subunit TctC
VLVVNPSIAAATAKELVEMLRANPGKYNYAMPGAGTPAHLSGELFRVALKLDIVPVPFGGGGPMIQSVVAGHTPIAFSSMPPAAPQIKAGLLRGLAVTSATRSTALPDVPTMAEAGFAGQIGATPQGILVPAGTPQSIVDLIYRETVRIVALPDIREKLGAIGFEPVANTPAEYAADLKAEIPKWRELIRAADIKME